MDPKIITAQAEAGAILELKDPAGEPDLKPDGMPVTITLAGTESKAWKKARNIVGNKYIQSTSRNQKQRSFEDGLDDIAFQLAAVTLAWDGIMLDGQVIECTQANAKRVYLESDTIREQVDLFVGDRKNFWKASLSN